MKNSGRRLALVVRYSDSAWGVDTVTEHIKVLLLRKFVYWGKFGKGLATESVALAMDQIKNHGPLELYLLGPRGITHRATVVRVVSRGPRAMTLAPDRRLVPTYYQDIGCGAWFRLSSIKAVEKRAVVSLRRYNCPAFRPDFSSSGGLFFVTRATREDEPAL